MSIIYTKHLIKQERINELKKSAELIKFGTIFFWIINFVILFMFHTGIGIFILLKGFIIRNLSLIMPAIGMTIIFVLISVLGTYILLLSTSIFSISYIWLLYKKRKMEFIQMVIHIGFQFLFFWDIVDMIFLKLKYTKLNENMDQ